MRTVSATTVQAQVLPNQVEMASTVRSSFCMGYPGKQKGALGRPLGAGWCRSALLGVAAEVVVVGHLEIDREVVLPLAGARGEGLLRVEHLLEQRVFTRLLGDGRVPGGQLGAQHRVGRLEELHAILLERVVVLA